MVGTDYDIHENRRRWIDNSVFPALACLAAVSALHIAFFSLENCVNADCPYKTRNVLLDSRLVQQFFHFSSVPFFKNSAGLEMLDKVTGCVLEDARASAAAVVCAFCTSSCLLLVILSILCPSPAAEEIEAYRRTALVLCCQGGIMFTYIIGVSEPGVLSPAICALWWPVKYFSRQIQAVLPLRSVIIRKRAQVGLWRLAALLIIYGQLASLCIYGSSRLLKMVRSEDAYPVKPAHLLFTRNSCVQKNSVPDIVYFELWTLPMDVITYTQLAMSETLHIIAAVSSKGNYEGLSDPGLNPEWCMELSEKVQAILLAARGSLLLWHRFAMLRCFGFHWRIGDFLLLSEIIANISGLISGLDKRLTYTLYRYNVSRLFPTASPGALLKAHSTSPTAFSRWLLIPPASHAFHPCADHSDIHSACIICHAPLHQPSAKHVDAKVLPCGHIFHLDCICEWLLVHEGSVQTCPLCRTGLNVYLTDKDTAALSWEAQLLGAIRLLKSWPWRQVILQLLHS